MLTGPVNRRGLSCAGQPLAGLLGRSPAFEALSCGRDRVRWRRHWLFRRGRLARAALGWPSWVEARQGLGSPGNVLTTFTAYTFTSLNTERGGSLPQLPCCLSRPLAASSELFGGWAASSLRFAVFLLPPHDPTFPPCPSRPCQTPSPTARTSTPASTRSARPWSWPRPAPPRCWATGTAPPGPSPRRRPPWAGSTCGGPGWR